MMTAAPRSTPATVCQAAGSAAVRDACPRYSASSTNNAATANENTGLRRGFSCAGALTGSVVDVPHR